LLAFQCQLILNMILSQLTKRFLLTWWRLLWNKQKPIDLTKYLYIQQQQQQQQHIKIIRAQR
jgi:hypothetical protein